MSPFRKFGFFVAALGAVAVTGASAQDAAEFYRGKVVRIVVGYPAGSTFDLYARALGRHMGKHLPGSPTVVVQNMPGAGGINAVSYVANVAAPDGLTLSLSNPQSTTTPLLEPKVATYDPRTFGWIGSVSDDTTACAFWAKDIKTLEDLKKREIVIGATGGTGGSAIDGKVLNTLFGYRFKVVTGYPGMAEVRLAAERGELDGQCGLPGSTINADLKQQVAEGKIVIPLQLGIKSNPDLGSVPNLAEAAKTDEERDILRVVYAPLSYMRPVMAPAAVPADRLQALRTAFNQTVQDPAFREDMSKQRLDVRPVPPEEILKAVQAIYATPAATIVRVRELLGLQNR
jgi:tripartite-type tricarboxylate transporter receptor subunit TctC